MAIFFCFKIMSFQFWCVLKDLVKFISLHLFKSCVKAFHSFFFKAIMYKKYVLKCDISFRILNLCIFLETGTLFGKNFIIWMAFSCNVSIFLNSVHWYSPHTWHP